MLGQSVLVFGRSSLDKARDSGWEVIARSAVDGPESSCLLLVLVAVAAQHPPFLCQRPLPPGHLHIWYFTHALARGAIRICAPLRARRGVLTYIAGLGIAHTLVLLSAGELL